MRAMQEQHKIAEFFTADKEKSHKQSGRNDCGERLAEKNTIAPTSVHPIMRMPAANL